MRDVTTDRDVIGSIVRRATVCRIAMCDEGQPYLVPVSFGYQDGALYFGRAFFVEGEEEKRQALDVIVAHYGGEPQDYPQATLEQTTVVRIEIQSATAKVSGY